MAALKRRQPKRDAELSGQPGIRKALVDVFADVQRGFTDQRDRSDTIMDNWDLYDCKLTDKQFYNGNSQMFMPFVQDAVDARKTRFTNQIFPQSGRYVEVTSIDGEIPHATMALLESYVRKTKLRTEVMPPLCVNGDVEGQYSLYVSWSTVRRSTVRREEVADQDDMPELGVHDEYVEEDEKIGCPEVEVIHDQDLLILPATADSIDKAIEADGSVTVLRRWTKGRIRKAIRDEEITDEAGQSLIKSMQRAARDVGDRPDPSANMADAAGIKERGSHVVVYETWTKLKVRGEYRLCRAYYGGSDNILGCKLCPYWCDLVPVISAPVKKMAGSVKGKAPVTPVSDLQILANDTINEGADTAHFSAMPIVMTDPEKNPRVSTMVLGLAAVWETSPNDTQFAQFPELWRDAFERTMACKAQIHQSLGINSSMMTGSASSGKMSQAEIANEQQVDILTTADAVTVIEEGILTPLIQRFAYYDHQFRDKDIMIPVYGEMGVRAEMELVPPIQLNNRWEFKWFGVEAARNAAQIQQQIAGLNVIKGTPPQMYPGYELDVAPMLVQLVENLFGPRLAPLIFKKKVLYSVPPDLENDMLENAFQVVVHEVDDDMAHMQVHMQLMAMGDPHGVIRQHIAQHQQQMQAKAAAQAEQFAMQAPKGVPGTPGGAGPGVAGTPAEGGMVEGPRLMKGPPGMIHPDAMGAVDPSQMPRQ